MSTDKFWEQWGAGSGQSGNPADKSPATDGSEKSGPVDDDVLAAWLKSLPPDDPLVPHPTALPSTSGNPADLAALWPPAAPVDPFAGISSGSGGTGGGEWDLAIEGTPAAPPTTPAAPVAPAAPAPPATSAAPPAAPSVPAPPSTSDFDLDLGGLSGPVPVGNPFAPVEPPATPAAPAAPPPSPFGTPPPAAPPVAATPPSPAAGAPAPVSPFGPPIPPVAPPAEALSAPPLKVEISIGRRTFNQDIRGEALIGRPDATRGIHPEIDLRQDDAVSRRHAKIFIRDGRYVLTDLNSTNGTRHNRAWVQPEIEIPLNPGDEVEVGELTLIRILEIPSPNA